MRCVFHKWSKWIDIVTEGGNEAQERRCEKCGVVERELHDYNKRKLKFV